MQVTNETETAIKALQHGGFDMHKLSFIRTDYHSEEDVVGFYNTRDRVKTWGKWGAFWGGIWGLFFGAAFFVLLGVGALLNAGPIVVAIVSALESAIVIGAIGACGVALTGLGIPKDSVVQYQTAVKAERARDILMHAGLESPQMHAPVAA